MVGVLIKIYVVVFVGALIFVYPENPPVAHTGGFGEPTCHACHFDGDLNDGVADLSLLGVKSNYTPNSNYTLSIALARSDMEEAGFQLAIRDSSGRQAGTLGVLDNRVVIDESEGIQYARHSPEGTHLTEHDSSSWSVNWLAPDSVKTVFIHLSANAANGDDSEFGDAIYQLEHTLEPHKTRNPQPETRNKFK